ncbi:MAG: FKBP-type peptidyl-prolyl cis-trans isomerase [Xanthomonadaceae bacterium]|nr:FKBP-type peptidyl-prolyl cis-trans isomerase [Xanthomonadaceae bacterium]
MKSAPRVLGALLSVLLASASVAAQDAAPVSDRDKVGYMIGLDVGKSIGPGYQDLDVAALQRAVENGMTNGKPLLDDKDVKPTRQALMDSIAARKAGKPAVNLDHVKAGLLVGTNIGHSLASIHSEFDLPMFMRGVKDGANPEARPALDATEVAQVRVAFSNRMAAVKAAKREADAQAASKQEDSFLTANKQVKGVFATPSGLQYMVLRQGNGPRPKPGQRVKVNYVGTLLDGKKFDSSYDRGEPAEFGLDQVIKGWSEGVGLMPVGAKYRFWIPARLGYGEKGAGADIPPNATLTFDVELLDIQ